MYTTWSLPWSLQLFSETLRTLQDRGLLQSFERTEISLNHHKEQHFLFLRNLLLPFVAGIWVSAWLIFTPSHLIPPHPHTLHPQPLTPSLLPHPSHLPQIPCRYFMRRNSLITRVSPIRLCVTTSSRLLVECSHSTLLSEEHSCWLPSVYTQVSTGPIPRPPTRPENENTRYTICVLSPMQVSCTRMRPSLWTWSEMP